MFVLLENIECLSPQYLGFKDILIVKDIIYKISEPKSLRQKYNFAKIIDCSKLLAFPGIIDGHVHLTGGGGEKGPSSRIEQLDIEDILLSGITTVVGLLGADNKTKNLNDLYAKAKTLEEEGITSYIYSGSYQMPVVTLTGNISSDLRLIDKVVGVGEIAISDIRSSHPDIQSLITLSSEVYMSGLLSGKTKLVHLHLGDGKDGLKILNSILDKTDLPKDLFIPTHLNRNEKLFQQAIEYLEAGGNIDLTAGEEIGLSIIDAVSQIISRGLDLGKVTISSDGNASQPVGGACKIEKLYEDIKLCLKNGMDRSLVISLVTENVAKRLGLYPQKGVILENSDADLVIIDKNYNIQMVIAKGNLLVKNGKYIKKSKIKG